MKNAIHILFVLLSLNSFGQTEGIEIIKDPRVDGLVRKQAFPLSASGIPQIAGYRVQLAFDSDKKKIDALRSRFISMNPTVETYIIYNAPNYLLKAGDCRNYNDAEKIRDASNKTFPACFIVREMINLPRLD
ncbi:MAG: SPOR domain-containing protein [Crocinitomicaceae bacterium]